MDYIKKGISKAEIVIKMQEELGLTSSQAGEFFDAIIETLSQALIDGKQVKCANFGTFNVKERQERMGVNPQTGQKMMINKTANTYFHASSHISGQLNKTEELW